MFHIISVLDISYENVLAPISEMTFVFSSISNMNAWALFKAILRISLLLSLDIVVWVVDKSDITSEVILLTKNMVLSVQVVKWVRYKMSTSRDRILIVQSEVLLF